MLLYIILVEIKRNVQNESIKYSLSFKKNKKFLESAKVFILLFVIQNKTTVQITRRKNFN